MRLSQKLTVIATLSAFAVALPGIYLLYHFATGYYLQRSIEQLKTDTRIQADVEVRLMRRAEESLTVLATLLKNELMQPPAPWEAAEFDRLTSRDAHGVVRNRKELFNGHNEAGLFMAPDVKLDNHEKQVKLRAMKVLTRFGASALRHFDGVWFDQLNKTSVIFWRRDADFIYKLPPDHDYTQTLWDQLASPKLNPGRTVQWTPAILESPVGVWVVSAVYPLDINGKWEGIVGHDIALTDLLASFRASDSYKGSEHFLIDGYGNYILAGHWQKALEAKSDGFKPDLTSEKPLARLLSGKPFNDGDRIRVGGHEYAAFALTIDGLGWRYYRLVDVNQVLAPMNRLFLYLAMLMAGMVMAVALMMRSAAGRLIALPIHRLAAMAQSFGAGNLSFRSGISGNDEVGSLGMAFDHMAEKLEENHHQISASEQRYRSVVSSLKEVVYQVDAEGRLTFLSPVWEKISGYSPSTYLGGYIWNCLVDEDRERKRIEFLEIVQGQRQPPCVGEYRLLTADGKLRWVEIFLQQSDTEAVCYSGSMDDITEKHQAVTAIQEARELAEYTTKAKSEFLANMSHEIRTPMNAIIGLSRLALNKKISDELRDYLEKINTSSESLLGILNDILDFSKIEAGRLGIENSVFNLDAILDNLSNMFQANAENKHLGFNIQAEQDIPVQLVGDGLRIQQVLANLIGNAIKFTEQGKIDIHVALIETSASQAKLRFKVSDTGIGISQPDQAKLFQPFSQVDTSSTRRFGGSGLGLVISQKLLQLMGSDFRIESVPGKGSIFSFDISLKVADSGSFKKVDRRSRSRGAGTLSDKLREHGEILHGTRILVVEDNRINQQIVKEFLTLCGVIVDVANHGKEALQLLEQHRYDAVLMDVHMPVMDGLETTRHIRAQQQYFRLPVIALTAGVTQEERDNCKASGMDDFVGKPVDPEKLVNVLCWWIGQQQSDLLLTSSHETTQPMVPSALQSLPGFDFSNLMLMVGGDTSKVMELVRALMEDTETTLGDIGAQLRMNDFEAARKLVHAIKGASGNLGAFALYAAALNLEATLKQGRFEQTIYSSFEQALKETRATLSHVVNPNTH